MATSSTSPKDLYMASSIEELNKKMSTANIDYSTPRLLGRSSNTLFLAAKDAAFQRDEEKAYVFFMRFLELGKKIRASKEYKSKKAEYDKLIPVQKIRTALDEAERLSSRLRERYSQPQGKRPKLDSESAQGGGVADQQVPNDTNSGNNKPLSAEDLYKRNSTTALVPQQPVAGMETKSAENELGTAPPSHSCTNAQDLFALLKSTPDDVIVLDCRPRSMFLASHPDGKKYPQWLSVPEEIITRGVTSESIAKFLRGNGRRIWKERGRMSAIVLVDAATTSADLASSGAAGLPLVQLRDAIHKYDTSVHLPRPPVYLEGGYTQWYLHYSPVCVGVWRLEGAEGSGGRGGGGEGGREEMNDGRNDASVDYPNFPEFSDNAGATEGTGSTEESSQPDQTTPTRSQLPPPVAMEEAIPVPSVGHIPPQPLQPTQVVPSAPPAFTAGTVTHHTPFSNDHTPSQAVPTHHVVYEPPPVMTILSLDDPNLTQDDPIIQLSTLPENQANQFRNDPHMQGPHGLNLQSQNFPTHHHEIGQPVPLPVQPNLAHGQAAVSHAQMNQQQLLQHPHIEQHGVSNPQPGQPVMFDPNRPHSMPNSHVDQQPVHNVQFPSFPELPAHAHPQMGQSYPAQFVDPQNRQPTLFVDPQIGQSAHFVDPQIAQPAQFVDPQIRQPAQYMDPQTGHMLPPPQVQAGHPPSQQVHNGKPHQQIVQPFPQPEQPPLQVSQPAVQYPQSGHPQPPADHAQIHDAIPNQRVAYGPIPNPPVYNQALQLPSQPAVQPPIPPPVSVEQQNQFQNPPGQPQNRNDRLPGQPQNLSGQYQNQPGQPQNLSVQYQNQPDQHQNMSVQYQNQPDQHQNLSVQYQNQPDQHQNLSGQYQNQPDQHQNMSGQYQNQPDQHQNLSGQYQNQPDQHQNLSVQYQNQPDQHQNLSVQYQNQPDQHQNLSGQYQNQPDQHQNMSGQYQNRSAQNHGEHYQNQVGQFQNHPDQFQSPVQPVYPPQDQVDPALARIQALESQLQKFQEGKEVVEKAQRDENERKREELEREKKLLQAEKARAQLEIERQKQLLVQEREEMVKKRELEVREFAALKTQVEEERLKATKESEQLKQMLQLQQSGETNQRTFAVNKGLPGSWEKRLDRTTGRFYYVDHSTKTTHWNPPANWMDYQAQVQRLKEQQLPRQPGGPGQISSQSPPQHHGGPGQISSQSPPQHHGGPGQISHRPPQQHPANAGQISNNAVQPAGVPGQVLNRPPTQQPHPGLKQPSPPAVQTAQPNLPSQTPTGQPIEKQVAPTVDRSSKPQAPLPAPTPTIDRSSKPAMSVATYKKKVYNLQPVFGSERYALTGLRNLGNTCFMNSTLQCLCSTTPFVAHFMRGSYRKDMNQSNPLGHGGVLAEEFNFLMKSMWSGEYRYISPRDFKDTIGRFAPTFSGNQQHDSQEFLAFLLDGLHEDMNRVTERRYIQNPDYAKHEDREAANIAWSLHKKRNDSIIVDLFQGQFRSSLKCLTCHHRSVNFEAFMYLSIPLPPGNDHCSLKDCIRLFTKEERVSGSDKWYCSACKQHRDASKRIEIWKLPSILLIHLKRFSYDGMWRQKKQNFVDFPFSGLDMSPDVVGTRDGPEKYNLFGVSNHFGTLTGGHYTAYCLNPYKQRYYCFDDQEVKEVNHRQVKSSAAYLLFYTSVDMTPQRMF